MDLKSYNKALFQSAKKAFDFSFIKDIDPADQELFFCNDTDTVKYKLLAKKNMLNLYFYFTDLENVWKYIENYFRATYYQSTSQFRQIFPSNLNKLQVKSHSKSPLIMKDLPLSIKHSFHHRRQESLRIGESSIP